MSLTYVPFCTRGSQPFFERFVRRYRPFGFSDIRNFSVDEPFAASALDQALASDALYLAGGNTFYFLHQLRRRGLLRRFREYAAGGGVVAGLSAGAILLTPNIGLAGYPKTGADDNAVGLTNLKALNLVPFEFFPHYLPRPALRSALSAYSCRSRHPIVAAADGGGVVVDNGRLTFIGRSELFLGGTHARLTP